MEKKQVWVMLGAVVAITLGISLYCIFFGNKYLITFDSNGGSEVESQYVQTGHKVEEPENPTREGYEFVEWQLDGKVYDFTEKVRNKFTLVASWRKVASSAEILYKVIFDSNGGSEVPTQEVEAGGKAVKPTDPVKSGYTFKGWYIGSTKFDFSKIITKDTTLKAKWKSKNSNKKPESTKKPTKKPTTDKKEENNNSSKLKVGDKVKIVGEYAESSTSKRALHSRAIGWKRVILKIYEGREFPYRVGDSTGTTGFFKASSLKKIG